MEVVHSRRQSPFLQGSASKSTGLTGLPSFIVSSFDGALIVPVIIDMYMLLSVDGLPLLYKLYECRRMLKRSMQSIEISFSHLPPLYI